VVAVSPNNPTGSYLAREDREFLGALCREHDMALIVDEVFLDYASPVFAGSVSTAAGNEAALTFVLSGLSKVAALPQLKLGWILVSGPAAATAEAGERLEFVADAYLSANAPVQHAAPRILAGREAIQVAIRDRLERNSAALIACDLAREGFRPLRREGGWYGVVRMPPGRDEEETVLQLLERGGVWVHPGYFYDFEENDALVVSLLTAPEVFAKGLARAAQALTEDA
jgi:alanine-synthesizing transaminase